MTDRELLIMIFAAYKSLNDIDDVYISALDWVMKLVEKHLAGQPAAEPEPMK